MGIKPEDLTGLKFGKLTAVRIIEKARQRAPRLCIVRSLLPGNAQTVTRCPGMAITRIRATREKAPCQDDGDR